MNQVKKAKSNHAQVAAALKKFAKANGLVASAKSQSYSGGSSVSLYVTDVRPAMFATLEQEGERYVYGHFDGMQDLYEYKKDREDLPMVSYVFVENEISDALRQQIWEFAVQYYGFDDAPASVKDASNYRDKNGVIERDGQNMVYRLFRGAFPNGAFWESVENAELAAATGEAAAAVIAKAMA
jgi:hypothetical protein